MSDEPNRLEGRPKRGEAAWREARERVAKRNAEARKAGKQRREAHNRQIEENRQAAERERHPRGGDVHTREEPA